jgi:acyl-CoA thioester hydrolase
MPEPQGGPAILPNPLDSERRRMPFTYRHRVRCHEIDSQGFMYNSRYLEVADAAMTEFFRHHGFPNDDLLNNGFESSVVKAEIDYKLPARLDEVIDVSVTCTRVGRSSYDLQYDLSRDGCALSTIRLVHVNVDAAEAHSRPIPDAIAAVLQRH